MNILPPINHDPGLAERIDKMMKRQKASGPLSGGFHGGGLRDDTDALWDHIRDLERRIAAIEAAGNR